METIHMIYNKCMEGRSGSQRIQGTRKGSQPKAMPRIVTMDEAMKFATDLSGLGLTQEEAKYCYGMSKMSVINENPGAENLSVHKWGSVEYKSSSEYIYLQKVEFLEFIGRITEQLYRKYYKFDVHNQELIGDGYSFEHYLELVI